MKTIKNCIGEDNSEDFTVKLLHYTNLHNNIEFEQLVIDVSNYSPNLTEVDSVFSDIPQTEDDDEKYVVFCFPPDCCIELSGELEDFLLRLDSGRFSHSLGRHPDLDPIHRSFLLDWIMEMCHFFSVSRDTYYHAVDYLDRYLGVSRCISRDRLQVVGLTCLYMASKWEDVRSIPIQDLLNLADEMFPEEEVLRWEREVLLSLDCRSSVWNPNRWLVTLLHKAHYRPALLEYARLTSLLDLVILDVRSLQYSYSVIASACIYQVLSLQVAIPDNSTNHQFEICQCIFWIQKYWDGLKKIPFREGRLKQLLVHQNKCKIIKYSIRQFYSDLLDIYVDVNNNSINL